MASVGARRVDTDQSFPDLMYRVLSPQILLEIAVTHPWSYDAWHADIREVFDVESNEL